jgi:hypothetical protein
MNIFFNRVSWVAICLVGGLLISCGEPDQDYKDDNDDRNDEVMADDQAPTGTDDENAYPRDEVQEETNLDQDDYLPMELGEVTSLIEQRKLLALLLRQKNDMEQRINELKDMPGDASDNTVVKGDIDKLRLYLVKLDLEILKVRKAQPGSMREVSESALGAVKGAGALMQSSVMRIDRGF